MGLVGLLIYGFLYYRLFKSANRLGVIQLWLIGFLVSFIIQSFFVDIWDIFPTNAYFWIIAALASVYILPVEE